MLRWVLVCADDEDSPQLRAEASTESQLYEQSLRLARTIATRPSATVCPLQCNSYPCLYMCYFSSAADDVSHGPRCQIGHGKGIFYEQLDSASLGDAYTLASSAMVEGMQIDDAKEGVAAFLEKRPPVWPSNLS